MRALIAIALTFCLSACLPPLNADTVDLAWERCETPGPGAFRITQCSMVIGFEGTTPERRAAALINRGSIRSTEGQYARALADFGRAMRIDGDNPQIFIERGLVHQARGAFDFAVRDFDRALALQPGLEMALQHRAEALQQRISSFEQELLMLNQRLTQTPTDANLLNSRCWLRVTNNDDLDAALADCNASLAAAPDDPNVLDSRGLVQFKRGDYSAALADYENAVRLEPENGHFLYGRGLTRIALGMNAEGAADQRRAEQLEPGIGQQYQAYNLVSQTTPEPLVVPPGEPVSAE